MNHSSYIVHNCGRKMSRVFVLVFASFYFWQIDMHTQSMRAELVPSSGWTQSPLCPLSLCYLAVWVKGWLWLSSPLICKIKDVDTYSTYASFHKVNVCTQAWVLINACMLSLCIVINKHGRYHRTHHWGQKHNLPACKYIFSEGLSKGGFYLISDQELTVDSYFFGLHMSI